MSNEQNQEQEVVPASNVLNGVGTEDGFSEEFSTAKPENLSRDESSITNNGNDKVLENPMINDNANINDNESNKNEEIENNKQNDSKEEENIDEYEPQIANNVELDAHQAINSLNNDVKDENENNSEEISSEEFKKTINGFVESKSTDETIKEYSDDDIVVDIDSDDDSSSSSEESSSSSDSSSSSPSDSDSDSDSDDEKENIENNANDLDDEETINGPIFSKNEVVDEDAPTIPPDYKVSETAPLQVIGKITGLVERSVIIKADISGEFRVLKENSILCFEDRTVLGPLFEIFGRLQEPIYRVKFNTEEEFNKFKDKKGEKVYYVVPDSEFLYTDTIKNIKGTDASNFNDEELPEEEQEFSDDEAELAHKHAKKKKKKAKNNKDKTGEPDNNSKSRKRHHGNNVSNDDDDKEEKDKKYHTYGYAQQYQPYSPQVPQAISQAIPQAAPQAAPQAYPQNNSLGNSQMVHDQMMQFQQNVFSSNSSPYGVPFNPQQHQQYQFSQQHQQHVNFQINGQSPYNPQPINHNPYQSMQNPYNVQPPQNNYAGQWNQTPQNNFNQNMNNQSFNTGIPPQVNTQNQNQNQLQQLQQLILNHLTNQQNQNDQPHQ